MRRSIFITQDDLQSPHWLSAFPNCVIQTACPKKILADTLVWLLADSADWQVQLQKLTAQRLPVIVMTTQLDIQQLCDALQLGARGYIEAFANKTVIEQVAETVNAGGIWLPGQLLSNLVGVLSGQAINYPHQCDLSSLTKREKQVVDEVIKGATNKQVAQVLNITERTVKEHMSSIFHKLKVRDRMQLMLAVKGH